MIFDQKQQNAKLVEIIADPHADESKWMAACVAVGERSLVKDEPSVVTKVLLPLAKGVARRSIAFNVLFSYTLMLLLAEEYTVLMGGPGRMWVGAHLGAGPALGMVFSFFGALGFWREFAGTKQNKWLPAIGLALAVCTLAIGFYSHKPLQVLLPICAGALSFYIMRKLGTYARKTLPPTFRSVKTHLLCGLSSAPCAILVIIAIVLRVIHPVTSIEDPPTVSMAYMSILSCFLALSTLAPTYVCTRVARSSSVASCMALNALFSAPLLCALFATALITTLTNVDPGNLFNTGTFALSIWGAWLSALAVVAGGTYLGAKRNAGVERRKLKRAGG